MYQTVMTINYLPITSQEKWWNLRKCLPAYSWDQLFRPDLREYEERFRAMFSLHILVTWHQVTLSVVLWVKRVDLLVGLHNFGRNGTSLGNAEPIHYPWDVIGDVMGCVMLFVTTVGRRAAWTGHRHQVSVHVVGAFA